MDSEYRDAWLQPLSPQFSHEPGAPTATRERICLAVSDPASGQVDWTATAAQLTRRTGRKMAAAVVDVSTGTVLVHDRPQS
ncbi:MAG: hypothetical protein GEV09_08640 [Pseudonocardiaceae bacterium]|nr:hypothetical protein [Pseudonocardiaceae bacterium]